MSVKDLLKSGNLPQTIYETKFYDYLRDWEKKKNAGRSQHFHASYLADKSFCLMKAVLEEITPKKSDAFPPKILSTFMVGIAVHDKHQDFYKETGMAEYVEQQYYSDFLQMTATPDALLLFMRHRTIAEIKSMNGFEFGKLVDPPKNAYIQAQIYMYVVGVPYALIVVENKNFQELKVFRIEFCLDDAVKYMKRRRAIIQCLKSNIIPISQRVCQKKGQKKCKYADVCWQKWEKTSYKLK